MKFIDSQIIVYRGNNAYFVDGLELKEKFECELIFEDNDIIEYKFLEDIYIDSVSDKSKHELVKIENVIYNKNEINMKSIYLNENIFNIENLIFFNNNNKDIYVESEFNNINKSFILKNEEVVNTPLDMYDDFELTTDLGYLVGYWLLRGGFQKIDNVGFENLSWSGRESDIETIKKLLEDKTYLTKQFKENKSDIIILIDDELSRFFKDNFKTKKNKTFPNWLFLANQDFIHGLFYGLIGANSYISYDKKNNYYLAVKVVNHELIKNISNLFEYKLRIYSRIIGEHNKYLSFKINEKVYNLIKDKKYFTLENFDIVTPVTSKEYNHGKFKLIPWYKLKISDKNIKNTFSLKLENNNIFMLKNGFFVSNI